MAKINRLTLRRRSGLFAKKAGDWFEDWLDIACTRSGWAVIKIPSGCRWVSATRATPERTPFDFVFVKNGFSIFGDAKTTLAKNWSRSMSTPHQLNSLLRLEKFGSVAGYIVNFRDQNKTVFFSASQLSSLKVRCSLKVEDGILLGNNSIISLDSLAVKNAVP